MDYYIVGGFEYVKNAFETLALISSAASYLALFAVAAVIGTFLLALQGALQRLNGKKVPAFSFILPLLIGSAFVLAFFTPKVTLHLYDSQTNAYAPIAGVPHGIAFVASTANKFERIITDLVDTSIIDGYYAEAGGVIFNLLSAADDSTSEVDYYLTKNIKEYYNSCGTVALSSPGYNVDEQELMRNTNDLVATMAKMAGDATFSVVYSAANKVGVTMTCRDAWVAVLQPALTNVNTYTNSVNAACNKAGFDPTDAAQLVACNATVDKIGRLYGLAGTLDTALLMRNVYLAKVISTAVTENAAEGQQYMAATQIVGRSFGMMQTMSVYYPLVRMVILTIIIATMVLLVPFLVTAKAKEAAIWMGGAFVFIALWGAVDAIIHKAVIGDAIKHFAENVNFKLGLESMWKTQGNALSALSMFGMSRTFSLTLATILMARLFGFTSHAFATMGNTFQQNLENVGGETGERTFNPERRDDEIARLARAGGTEAMQDRHGYDSYSSITQGDTITQTARGSEFLDRNISEGHSAFSAYNDKGTSSGGSEAGRLDAERGKAGAGGIGDLTDHTAEYQRTEELSHVDAQSNVISADAAGHGTGTLAGHDKTANEQFTLEHLGNEANEKGYVSGREHNLLDTTTSGKAHDQMERHAPGSTATEREENYSQMKADQREGAGYGSAMRAENVSSVTGENLADASARVAYGTSPGFIVGPEGAKTVNENVDIPDGAESEFLKNGGEVRLQQAIDGDPTAVGVNVGLDSTVTDQVRKTSGVTETGGGYALDTSATIESLNTEGAGAVTNALEYGLNHKEQQAAIEEQVVNSAGGYLSTIGQHSRSLNASEGKNRDIYADASVRASTPSRLPFGASAVAGVVGRDNANTSETDSATLNANREKARAMLDRAKEEARTTILQAGDNPDAPENYHKQAELTEKKLQAQIQAEKERMLQEVEGATLANTKRGITQDRGDNEKKPEDYLKFDLPISS
jgi:hypothetical protein